MQESWTPAEAPLLRFFKKKDKAMKYDFPEKFHTLLRSLPLDFDPFGEIDGDQEEALADAVSDLFSLRGVNEAGDGESEIGTLCADFLTWLAQNEQ